MLKKPRLIIGILMHDTGLQLGCFGAGDAKTPNLDLMAAQGVKFENHFSTGTVCVPSRASILTGRYFHNAPVCRYAAGEPTLPRSLHSAGYDTWRLGFAEEGEYASPAGSPLPYPDTDASGTGLLGYDHSWTASAAAADVADRLIEIISEKKDSPLYIAAAFREAHSPYDADVTEEEMSAAVLPPKLPQLPDTAETRRLIAQFNRLVRDADGAIGRILSAVRSLGLYDETLVYYSCDHGVDLPRAKQTCYDSGTRVPLIFWGGVLPRSGAAVQGLSSHLDLAATICEFAGIPAPSGSFGVSQMSQILGDASKRGFCVSEVSRDNTSLPVRSIRTEKYRYIRNFNPGWPSPMAHTFARRNSGTDLSRIYGSAHPAEELYDLESDPAEINNLAGLPEYREIKLELISELFAELARTGDGILMANSEYSNPKDPPLALWRRAEDGSFHL